MCLGRLFAADADRWRPAAARSTWGAGRAATPSGSPPGAPAFGVPFLLTALFRREAVTPPARQRG
jgi:hypothetical protein